MLKRNDCVFFIALLTYLSFVFLFIFRAYDDNRLMSWAWVFNGVDAAGIFLVLLAGAILLIPLSKVSFPIGSPGLFLFLSSFVAVVPFWSEPEVIVDASRYFIQAKYLEVYGIGYFVREWGKTIVAWTDLPLVPFLYGLIFRTLGESRLYVQILTTVMFSLSVVITYLLGKELWDKETGFRGGAILLGFPYLLVQVPLMLVDVPTMFFLVLAIFCFVKAMNGRGIGSIIAGSLGIFLALLSKYSTWPMLSVLGVVFVVLGREASGGSGRTRMFRGLITVSIALLLLGTIVLLKSDVFTDQIRLLMSYQKPGLKRWGESLGSTFLFQTHPFITVFALVSVWVALRKKDSNYLIISWLVALMVVFRVERIRYVLPLFPMVALMASYGLNRVKDEDIRRFVVFCTLLSSIVVAGFVYLPFAKKMSLVNLKDAGLFLNSLEERNVEVLTFPPKEPVLNPAVAVPLLDLYTDKKIIYHYESSVFVPREEVKTSSLRFTWEYKNPGYYTEKNPLTGDAAVRVVIAGDLKDVFPLFVSSKTRDYQVVRAFVEDEGVFQHKTFVGVYRRLSPPPAE